MTARAPAMGEGADIRWARQGLRTRFKPRSRLGHGLISLAPWLDAALVFFMFSLLNGQMLQQPGVRVVLPRGPLSAGTRLGMVAVVLAVPDPESGRPREIVFFNDQRFLVEHGEQVEALRASMAATGMQHPGEPLTLQADARVSHGTVVRLMELAGEAGIAEVSVAVRADGGGGRP